MSPSLKKEDQRSKEAATARVSVGGQSGVASDKILPRKLKSMLYMTVTRAVLVHGAECWTVGKMEEQILEKTEMRILRRSKRQKKRDKVKKVDIRKEPEVNSIKQKIKEMRLRQYGHMQKWKKTIK